MSKNISKLVVKIGTSSLTYPNGKLNLRRMKKLVEVCTNIKNSGIELILVSSGAIGAGVGKLSLDEKPSSTDMKQAIAAIGQAFLIQFYQKYFSELDQMCAQVLLTNDVVCNQVKKENVIRTLDTLQSLGVIPILNENDTISTDEIEGDAFGDNDQLSAIVSKITNTDLLVMFSDIDGLHNVIDGEIQDDIIPYVPYSQSMDFNIGASKSKLGTGGIKSKLNAIQYATDNGINVALCNANNLELLYDCIENNQTGTYTYFERRNSHD